MDPRPTLSQRLRYLLSVPFIYGMLLPLLLFHLVLELYHRICFPLYGIRTVRARDYFVIDRHKVQGLEWMQRLQCAYCGYGNGLMAYAREIIARTEAFWCPMQHRKTPEGTHPRHDDYCPYGDAEGFPLLRKRLQDKLKQA